MKAQQASRRAALTRLGALGAWGTLGSLGALGLSGCGFELRRAPEFAFASLFTRFAQGSPLGAEFNRSLAQAGTVEVITDPALLDRAEAVLDVLSEQRERAVVGQGTVGQVREFQLRLRVRFRLRSGQGRELIEETELLQQREISFSESQALAKESEEQLLFRDMQKEMVVLLMLRLAAVKKL